MGKHHIHIVQLEVLETLQGALDNVLPAETSIVVRLLSGYSEEDLGADDVVSAVLGVSS